MDTYLTAAPDRRYLTSLVIGRWTLALSDVKQRAIIHSDITVGNVLRTHDGDAMLIDFGVSLERGPNIFMFKVRKKSPWTPGKGRSHHSSWG